MGAPPSEAGCCQDTATAVSPGTAVAPEGDAGAVTGGCGTTALDGADAGEVRFCWLVARTVNVYAVPLVSPVTVQDSWPLVAHPAPPGAAVTTYRTTAAPPLEEGACHDTVAA